MWNGLEAVYSVKNKQICGMAVIYWSLVKPLALQVKNSPGNAGDVGSVSELGTSPGEGHGNPLQNSCLEDSMDRAAGQATVHGLQKGWTWLSGWTAASQATGNTETNTDRIVCASKEGTLRASADHCDILWCWSHGCWTCGGQLVCPRNEILILQEIQI